MPSWAHRHRQPSAEELSRATVRSASPPRPSDCHERVWARALLMFSLQPAVELLQLLPHRHRIAFRARCRRRRRHQLVAAKARATSPSHDASVQLARTALALLTPLPSQRRSPANSGQQLLLYTVLPPYPKPSPPSSHTWCRNSSLPSAPERSSSEPRPRPPR